MPFVPCRNTQGDWDTFWRVQVPASRHTTRYRKACSISDIQFYHERRSKDKRIFFFLQKRNLSQRNELEDDKNGALLFISYNIISHCFSISDSFHYSFQVKIASPCKKLKLKSLLIELPKKASDITFSCLLCLVEKKRTAVQKPHPFSGATSS